MSWYLDLGSFRGFLAVPGPASLSEVVDRGELNERGEHEGIAHGDEPVHGGGIGHLGQRVPGADAECGHRQHRGHPWGWGRGPQKQGSVPGPRHSGTP